MLVLAALVCVFLLANAAFVWVVEHRTEQVLEKRLGSQVDVDLSGWPVGPRIVAGSLPKARLTVENVRVPGSKLSLGTLDVNLSDVHYDGEREGPLDPPIEARNVSFELSLNERQASGLASSLPLVKGARLENGSLKLLLVRNRSVEATLFEKRGELFLKLHSPLFEPELPLTPGGVFGTLYIERVRVMGDEVVIRGTANGLGI